MLQEIVDTIALLSFLNNNYQEKIKCLVSQEHN